MIQPNPARKNRASTRQPRKAAGTGPAALAELRPTGLARAELLLRTLNAVEVQGQHTGRATGGARPLSAGRLAGQFLEAGTLPSAALLHALHGATSAERLAVHGTGLEAVRRAQGAHPSLPQLANFAATQVSDTAEFLLARVAHFMGLGTDDLARCTLRHQVNARTPGTWGLERAGLPSAPASEGCAVGRLGTAVQGACELCHFRVGDPAALLELAQRDRHRQSDRSLPHRSVDLMPPSADAQAALLAAVARLAGQTTPPSATEREDLVGLMALLVSGELRPAAHPSDILAAALSTGMPQRELRALVVGTLLRVAPAHTDLIGQLQTALGLLPADLLRILDVMGGGDGTLARPPLTQKAALAGQPVVQLRTLHFDWSTLWGHFSNTPPELPEAALPIRTPATHAPHLVLPALSRPLRRAVAQALETSLQSFEAQGQAGAALAWEGVAAYPEAFKRLFAALHLNERGGRACPRAAALAHLLSGRGQVQDQVRLAPTPAVAAAHLLGQAATPRLRTLMGQVETALALGDLPQALVLLATRPGLLGRMADRLIRLESGALGQHAPLTISALADAAPALKASMIAGLSAHFEHRDCPDPCRSVRARGEAVTRQVGDTRSLLSRDLIGQIQRVLLRELIRRAERLSAFSELVVQPDVLGLRLAASARAASGGHEGLAAGSRLRLTPDGTEAATTARLFLHWAEQDGAGSIDLDLSATAVNAAGQTVFSCTFGSLRTPGMVHSGDLRSAPLPAGATEYIDLDLAALRQHGVAQVIASVHSYTSVPFDQMERAACGVMSRTRTQGSFKEMDAATTRARFDLRGAATSKIVCVLELGTPGQEQLVFVDRQDDQTGFLTAGNDRQSSGALALTQRAEGVGVDLLLSVHAVRAQVVRAGAQTVIRRGGEPAEAFAHRVQGALQALALGLVQPAPAAALPVPAGPRLHVLDQSLCVLPRGDTLVEVRRGLAQSAEVHDLRWLVDSLPTRPDRPLP